MQAQPLITLPQYTPPRRLDFEAEIEAVPRPVVLRGRDFESGIDTQMHVHSRCQLVFATTGTMTVFTGLHIWAVPPQRAVWIPAGVEHAVLANERLCMRSIFIDPSRETTLRDCCMISVMPLLRELILYAMSLPTLYELGSPADRIMTVLIEQLEAAPLAPLWLPMPADKRLQKIASALLQHPADQRSVSAWAKHAGLSTRTLSRLFPLQTGMSFRYWQQSVRVLEALRRLAQGESVSNVAIDVGYSSSSAFVSMFKSMTGATPAQYYTEGLMAKGLGR